MVSRSTSRLPIAAGSTEFSREGTDLVAGAKPDNGRRSGHTWLAAFLGFLKIGATAFGGGSATIVAMRQLSLRRGWLTEDEFLDTVVLSRVTPGISILAQAVLIGRKVDGIRGVIAALAGMLLPSITITILLARLYVEVQHKEWSEHPLAMVEAVAAGFAVSLTILLLKDTLVVDRHWRGPVAFLAYVGLGAALPNPVLILAAAVVLGVLVPRLFVAKDAVAKDKIPEDDEDADAA